MRANKDEDIVRVRINNKERAVLEKIKLIMNLQNDSTALKYAAIIGSNVLQSTFDSPFFNVDFKKKRLKKEESYY